MRSIISFQARNCARSVGRGKYRAPCSAVRWSSSEARQWSTPLAKQLSEAITVHFLSFQFFLRID
jgi:NADH dehydrogenase [ubiquinone] 1 alpha subcomplex assembly factor 7